MENRRQHYRHAFAPTHSLFVRLQSLDGASSVEGELIDLSIGGMCVCASGMANEGAEKWIATLSLDTAVAPLSIPMERVHRRDGAGACCGFRFLDAVDEATSAEREKAIWTFLLNEQRRRRRQLSGW